MTNSSSGDPSGAAGGKPVDPRLARRRQDALGQRLRTMYDEVVNEAVPDDFLSFLEEADGRSAESGARDAAPAPSSGANKGEA